MCIGLRCESDNACPILPDSASIVLCRIKKSNSPKQTLYKSATNEISVKAKPIYDEVLVKVNMADTICTLKNYKSLDFKVGQAIGRLISKSAHI